MKPDEAVAGMAARLDAVDGTRHGDKAWSRAALLKEYLRRAARWAIAYESDTRTPFFDIAFPPLILLFERGGGFHTENGEVNLEWKSVRLAGWRRRADDPPLRSVAADHLDELDRAGSLAQFGYVMGPDGEPPRR